MYYLVKRIFDFLFSFLVILLISPVLVILILTLALTGEREVFYRQNRVGKGRVHFGMLKFATMLKNSPEIGSKSVTLRNDPRVTRVGSVLRKTKINELPQFFNVLFGQMSFVGPRPLIQPSFAKYPQEVQQIISQSVPGITGIASLVFRDEEKLVSAYAQEGGAPLDYYHQHVYPYKAQLEVWYAQNKSFKVDFLLILLTAWSVLNSKSELVYKVFKTLPCKPQSLTIIGVLEMGK
jgi:lipopolysaccharide/colanic/teichoic acid biosynthesis glycosyltransferase